MHVSLWVKGWRLLAQLLCSRITSLHSVAPAGSESTPGQGTRRVRTITERSANTNPRSGGGNPLSPPPHPAVVAYVIRAESGSGDKKVSDSRSRGFEFSETASSIQYDSDGYLADDNEDYALLDVTPPPPTHTHTHSHAHKHSHRPPASSL
jgi:hypothetical protein